MTRKKTVLELFVNQKKKNYLLRGSKHRLNRNFTVSYAWRTVF